MSDTPNYRGDSSNTCGYTQAEIEARAISKSSKLWKVRCLNGAAHKNDDSHPSAFYYPENGWYGCNVCGRQGFASDRLYSAQQKRVNGQRPPRRGSKTKEFLPDRIPPHAELTATHFYKRAGGKPTIHRVRRYDWVDKDDEGNSIARKEYLPQHLAKGRWSFGTGDIQWEPYNADALATAKLICVVEGEKCADAASQVAPEGTAVITSAFGTNSAWKTDWACLRDRLNEDGARLAFIPDCDEPGVKYIHSIAWELNIDTVNVIQIGDGQRDDGYDVADWLSEGNGWDDLPRLVATRVISKEEFDEHRRPVKAPSDGVDISAVDMLNDFNPKPLEWHVKGVIPKGKLTVLFGRSGIGKSTMALYLAARMSSENMLFDEPPRRAKTLIYAREDDWDDTTAVRLKLMGADFSNIGHLRSFANLSQNFDWMSKVEVDVLHRYVAIKGYDLLIIDPIIDLLGGNQSNNDPATVRRAIQVKLGPIRDSGCAVIGVHHERKDVKPNQQILDRMLGSQAWGAEARSVLYMQAVHKYASKQRVAIKDRDLKTNSKLYGAFVVGTSNIADVNGGWHYELPLQTYEDHESPHPTVVMRSSRITGLTPHTLVNQYDPFEAPPKAPTQRLAEMHIKDHIDAKKEAAAAKTRAAEVVKQLLADGSAMKMPDIIEAVSDVDRIGDSNIRDAVREVCESEGNARSTVWRLR